MSANKLQPKVLHGFCRSSAAWRVRIALNLKGLTVSHVAHNLRQGEQSAPDYLTLNPQGLVPTLVLADGTALTQSLAIMAWLDEAYPTPPLLPADPILRARARAFTVLVVADTHPLQNLKILRRLREAGLDQAAVNEFAAAANRDFLAAGEILLAESPGPFCFGAHPTLADIVLVPQLFSARRFGVDVSAYKNLLAREAACLAVPAFADADPGLQADAE